MDDQAPSDPGEYAVTLEVVWPDGRRIVQDGWFPYNAPHGDVAGFLTDAAGQMAQQFLRLSGKVYR